MEHLKEFYRNHIRSRLNSGTALLLVVLLCVSSLVLQYFERDDAISPLTLAGALIVPFQESVNELGSLIFEAKENRRSLSECEAEIDALQAENDELKLRISSLEALREENRELRELLNASELPEEYGIIEATVIGNDGVNIFSRFLIDKGSRDGIEPDMNVVNADGLIGLVTSVGKNYAVVTSIIEDSVNVSAMTRSSHENCIVTGDLTVSGPSVLNLSNVLAEAELTDGTALVTSNISDRYLPYLLIGYASGITENDGGLTKSGIVKTAVDFTDLKEVLVITSLKERKEEAE